MELFFFIRKYIDHFLKNASYEFDKKTKSWCGWIKELPGVYAQGNSVEETRKELEEMIEEYIELKLERGGSLPPAKILKEKIHA